MTWVDGSRRFVDTNIVVYANDAEDPAKHLVAAQLLAELVSQGTGVISTQVLQEYAATALRKLRQPTDLVYRQIYQLEFMETVTVTPGIVRRAIGLAALHRISYWDACIIAAAESARCTEILSEDLSAGHYYSGIRVVNPFAPE